MPERARFSAKKKRSLGYQILKTSHKGLVFLENSRLGLRFVRG